MQELSEALREVLLDGDGEPVAQALVVAIDNLAEAIDNLAASVGNGLAFVGGKIEEAGRQVAGSIQLAGEE